MSGSNRYLYQNIYIIMERLNKSLRDMKKDGTIRKIITKYIGEDPKKD